MGAVTLYQHAFIQGPRIFALFESLEDIMLPVLPIENLGLKFMWQTFQAPSLSLEFGSPFSQVEQSLQYFGAVFESEKGECNNNSIRNQRISSKQSLKSEGARTENWKMGRRKLFRLVLGCSAPFDVLCNALQQYSISTSIEYTEDQNAIEEQKSLQNYVGVEATFMESMLNGFRKLMEFENLHPELFLHAKLEDGSCYRIPPVSFLYVIGLREIFSIGIHRNIFPALYWRRFEAHSQLVRLFIEL